MYKLIYILANALLILVMLAFGLISFNADAQPNLIVLALVLSFVTFILSYVVAIVGIMVWEFLILIFYGSIVAGCMALTGIVAFFGLPYIFLSVGIWGINLFANLDLTIHHWFLVAVLAWIPTILTLHDTRR